MSCGVFYSSVEKILSIRKLDFEGFIQGAPNSGDGKMEII